MLIKSFISGKTTLPERGLIKTFSGKKNAERIYCQYDMARNAEVFKRKRNNTNGNSVQQNSATNGKYVGKFLTIFFF